MTAPTSAPRCSTPAAKGSMPAVSPAPATRRPATIVVVSACRAASRLAARLPSAKPAVIEHGSITNCPKLRSRSRPATKGAPARKT